MTAIPYTVEPRPDTGINNVKLGTWLFLASEAMLFGGLFSAYFMLRAGATTWPPPANQFFAIVNTVLLFSATFATAIAIRSARAGRAYRVTLVLGIVLLAAFVGVKGLEYRSDIVAGLLPRTNTRMALYYLLTAVHALHVIGGALVALAFAARRQPSTPAERAAMANRLQALGLYWYFVDAIWLMLLGMLYV